VLLTLSCSPAAPPPPALPVPQPAATLSTSPPPDEDRDVGNACREQVAGLEDWLRAVEAAGLPLAMSLLDEGSSLVKREGPKLVDPAPLVHVTTSQVLLDGVPVDLPRGLGKELTDLIELRRSMMPRSPFIASPVVYLAVNQDVAWQRLVQVVREAAYAGIKRVTFVFANPARTVPAPPPSPIDKDLARLRKSGHQKRQQIIAELIAYVYQDCPEGLKVIAQMGVNEVADFKQVILDELPAAIGACSCAPEEAGVKALHWAIFGNPQPTSGVTVYVATADRAESPTLSIVETMPWSEASATVTDVAKGSAAAPLRFEAKAETKKKK
jgi:hypothetical protein